MQIKVGNFLNWANIVLSNKEVSQAFVDDEIFHRFPRTVNHFQNEEEFNYLEIIDVLDYFFSNN